MKSASQMSLEIRNKKKNLSGTLTGMPTTTETLPEDAEDTPPEEQAPDGKLVDMLAEGGEVETPVDDEKTLARKARIAKMLGR